MDSEQRRAWLAALKPGDEVVVSGLEEYTTKVLRRTPSGRIVIKWGSGELEFTPDGRERGGDRYWSKHLEPLTDHWRAAFEHRALAAKLGAVQWRGLSLETLRRVVDVVKGDA